MKISEKAVNDFRDIWQKQFAQEIPFEEAREYAEQLLSVLQIAMRPVPSATSPPINNKGPPNGQSAVNAEPPGTTFCYPDVTT